MLHDRQSNIVDPHQGLIGVFVSGDPRPIYDFMPFQGGVFRVISNVAASTPTTIAHTLRRIPRTMQVIYAHGVFTPKWQDTAAWDAASIYVEFDTAIPAAPAYVVLWIG